METTSTVDMVRTVTVINQKGGVGKTTAAANIGHGLARLGARVLAVDFAPSSGLSALMGARARPGESIDAILTNDMPDGAARDLVQPAPAAWQPDPSRAFETGGSHAPGGQFDLIPGSPRLQTVVDNTGLDGAERLLLRALSGVASTYDIVLIDADPSIGRAPKLAQYASSWVLTPTFPERGSIDKTVTQFQAINAFARAWSHPLRHVGVLCTDFDSRESLTQGKPLAALRDMLATFESPVPNTTGRFTLDQVPNVTFGALLPQIIPHRAAVKDAAERRAPVVSYRKDSSGQLVGTMYAQVGLVLLHLTHPEKAAEVVAQLATSPLAGVWPPSPAGEVGS